MENITVDMEAFRNGDRQAFKQIFDKYHRMLTLFASQLTNHAAEAEEIVQDSFIKLFAKCRDFALENNIKAFLYITVRNACYNFIKLRNRNGKRLKEYQHQHDHQQTHNLETDTYHAELIDKIYRLLPELPKKNGEIVQLYLQGKSYAEIAQVQNTTIDNVVHHIGNAAKKLRKLLSLNLLNLL